MTVKRKAHNNVKQLKKNNKKNYKYNFLIKSPALNNNYYMSKFWWGLDLGGSRIM